MALIAPARTLERLARRLQPDLKGRKSKLAHYVREFEANTPDTRVLACELHVRGGRQARITGMVSLRQQASGLRKVLRLLGLGHVEVSLRILESRRANPLALVTGERLFLFDTPESTHGVTQLLAGETVRVMSDRYKHRLLVQSPSGYLGWARADGIEFVDEARWIQALPPANVRLARRALAQAEKYMDQHYVWSGRGPVGVDCSGLVQMSWAAAGIHLPRDSDQQLLCGWLVGTPKNWQGLAPGDIMFFAGDIGRITHVGLHIEHGEFIEAALPVVRHASINDQHANYSKRMARSFVYAKRIVSRRK